ncbi:MAG: 30S ribosomal protein S9 [Pirellulaceae bacterium]
MVAVKKDKINGDALGTGRRKSAVARVRIRTGNGNILINKRPLEEYFSIEQDRRQLTDTLELAGSLKSVDVVITVRGGGTTGQAGACKMGIARALVSYDMASFPPLRDAGVLTRDSRMKERKKYGLHGARKGTQFSKR